MTALNPFVHRCLRYGTCCSNMYHTCTTLVEVHPKSWIKMEMIAQKGEMYGTCCFNMYHGVSPLFIGI